MGLGQKLSMNIAPLLLRTALAATFIWIGMPMLRHTDLSPQQTARLANAEVRTPSSVPQSPPAPVSPSLPQAPPNGGADGVPATPPLAGVSLTRRAGADAADGESSGTNRVTIGQPQYTAADFEGTEQRARRWVLVALAGMDAAQPVSDGDDTTADRSVLPAGVGNGGVWVRVGAIAFALIVAFGGAVVAIGLFTRIWALGLAVCTGLSMWVLEIGPVWAKRDGLLGFLPDPMLGDPMLASTAWMPLMLHFVVLMTALALLIIGPGKLSMDWVFFGRGRSAQRNTFDEDDA